MSQSASKSARASTAKAVNQREESVDPSTLEDKLGFCLRMADRAIYKMFIQNVGMTPIQYSIFTLVADNEGMSQGAIGEALNLDRASTMAIMDRLESAGLIERRKSPVDRRRHALYLTAKGKRQITEIERKVCETDNRFKQRFSEKQLTELIRCLELIRRE